VGLLVGLLDDETLGSEGERVVGFMVGLRVGFLVGFFVRRWQEKGDIWIFVRYYHHKIMVCNAKQGFGVYT